MEEDSKMEAIKKFIETCPYLKKGKIAVDYLKDDINNYSINRSASNLNIEKDILGNFKKQIVFDFTVSAPISSHSIVNLTNSKFCEDFIEWIENQNRKGILPKISGCEEISCTSPRIFVR